MPRPGRAWGQDALEAQPERGRVAFQRPFNKLAGDCLCFTVEQRFSQYGGAVACPLRPSLGIAAGARREGTPSLYLRCIFSDRLTGFFHDSHTCQMLLGYIEHKENRQADNSRTCSQREPIPSRAAHSGDASCAIAMKHERHAEFNRRRL